MPDIKLPRRLRRARPFNRESAWEVHDDIGTNGPEWAVRAYLLGLLMGGPRTRETCAIRVQGIAVEQDPNQSTGPKCPPRLPARPV